MVKYASGADILIHEVYYKKAWEQKDEFWRAYHAANHTSTTELGELAAKAKPGMVVLYHILFWGATDNDLLNEIKETYNGKVIVGKDLDIY